MTTLATISTFFVLLPLTIGILYYRRLSDAGRKVVWLLIAWMVAESIAQILARKGIPNWDVYVILSFAEILIVTEFFRSIFINEKAKKVIELVAWCGIVLACTEYIVSKSADNSITMFFECTFFFCMGLFAFYEMVIYKLWQYDLLVTSIMIFFLASAIYFSTWKFIKYDRELFLLFGNVHAFVLIFCYNFFAYSIWRSL